MRFRHPDGSVVHLAYCTNVHPAEDVAGILAQLRRFAAPVRERLATARLGVGLWLPAAAAAALRGDERALSGLKAGLDAEGLEVVTLNGFPYRAFHAPVVKRDVYRPDWSDPARLAYTLDLAWVLVRLMPDDVAHGSISTLPLGWRVGWTEQADAAARRALDQAASALAAQALESGRRVALGLEPEPGCAVETVAQAIDVLGGADPEWIGLCLDACHLAVQFEDADRALEALAAAGVAVVKAQVSSALRARPRPDRSMLEDFAEPRFLHQTRERVAAGPDLRVAGADDLPAALAGELPGESEWRVHFHVPVHLDGAHTTQPQLRHCLRALVGGPAPATRHLEVETYTWTVLPGDRRPTGDEGLIDGLARELAWTRERLLELGLEEAGA